MSRYLGDDITTAVKLPCAAAAVDDVLAVDPADAKKFIYQKAATNNIANLAVTTGKVAANAITGAKISTALVLEGTLRVPSGVNITPAASDGLPHAIHIDRATTNQVNNPSFEVNVTDGWTLHGTDTTRARNTVTFYWGVASALVTAGAAGGNWGMYSNTATAVQNDNWSGSCWAAFTATGKTLVLKLEFLDAGSVVLQTVTKTYSSADTSFGPHYFVTGTATDAATASVRLKVETSSASAAFYLDGVQLEKQNFATNFADGSLGPGYAWSGTANNSSSTRTNGFQSIGGVDNAAARPIWIKDTGAFVVEWLLQAGTDDLYSELSGDGGVTAGTGNGGGVQYAAQGSASANIDLRIKPKGAGFFGIGTGVSGSYSGSTTTLITVAYTTAVFPTKDYELGGNNYNTTTGIFTAPENGEYEFNVSGYFAPAANSECAVRFNLNNGSRLFQGPDFASSVALWGATHFMRWSLATNDTMRVQFYNGDAANKALTGVIFQFRRVG